MGESIKKEGRVHLQGFVENVDKPVHDRGGVDTRAETDQKPDEKGEKAFFDS